MSAEHGDTANGPGDAVWEAYTAWVGHVHPAEDSGREPCWACVGAATPGEGCPDGIKLYGVYRLAKISGSVKTAT